MTDWDNSDNSYDDDDFNINEKPDSDIKKLSEDFTAMDNMNEEQYQEETRKSANLEGHRFEYEMRFKDDQTQEVYVKVTEIKQEKNSMIDSYYKFRFEARLGYNSNIFTFDRRFSDFELQYNYLTFEYKGYMIPHLPSKNLLSSINMMTNEALDERRKNLELFMLKILYHKTQAKDTQVQNFIDQNIVSFKDQCKISDYGVQKIAGDVTSTITNKVGGVTNYIGSFFYSKKVERDVKETKTHEDMLEHYKEFKEMRQHVEMVIDNISKLIDKMSQRSEASQKMSSLFNEQSRYFFYFNVKLQE